MTKDLVAKVLAIVILMGIIGWWLSNEFDKDILRMQSMSVDAIAEEALTPILSSSYEVMILSIAFGVTILILTELLGFFIKIIFFRKLEETNIIHNHNITLQIPNEPIADFYCRK